MRTDEALIKIDINSIAEAMVKEYTSQLLKEGKVLLDIKYELYGTVNNPFVRINVAVEG